MVVTRGVDGEIEEVMVVKFVYGSDSDDGAGV